jgi:hypothetical protein
MKKIYRLTTFCFAISALGFSTAHAGPCNTTKSTEMRDAGSGPTPGSTKTTVGTNTNQSEHPPTSALNKETGSGPASSEDAQRQMQGQPTVAQQAQGAKADDC